MAKKKVNDKTQIWGWIFLLIGLTPVIVWIVFDRPQYIAWFSNHTFIILGLALLFKSRFWAFAELCLGAIPELVWSTDFLYSVFTGKQLWGFTAYMFKNGTFDLLHLYSLQHILFIPAAIYAMYLLGGPVKKAWIGSIAHGVVMWGASFMFPFDFNINCVYHKCIFDLPNYQIAWPLFMIVHIFVIYAVVIYFWKKKAKLKKRR